MAQGQNYTIPTQLSVEDEDKALGNQTFIPAAPGTFVPNAATFVKRLSTLNEKDIVKFHEQLGQARAAGVQSPAGQLIDLSVLV
jgi:hypothetical protein